MHGDLNEIDIRSIVQLIELGQRTGVLFVEADCNDSHSQLSLQEATRPSKSDKCKQESWFVFFLNGQIIYAANGDSSLTRLKDYLAHYRISTRLEEVQIESLASVSALEYSYIWALLEEGMINPTQARSIIHSLIHETLFDILSLHQGSFIFKLGSVLAPQLTSLEITPTLAKIMKQVQEWKQLYPHFQSPNQLPVLTDITQLRSSLSVVTVNKLQHWADGKTSLRQLARYLNRDILTVAKALNPYVQQGWIQMVYPVTSSLCKYEQNLSLEVIERARIVCIDDATTICKTVESILKPQGYDAIGLTNSLQALSLVFQLQPHLILCDITMPELDGYEICAMLRHSRAFRMIPIIMLTAKGGFIDRAKAAMVGATDYLTKPFGDAELLTLVERYVHSRVVESDKRDTTLVDPLKDGVKNMITESANLG
jgi:twitching motility two-component system response regulator PilG